MRTYLVYESSKGRKDLVFVSSSLDLAVGAAIDWSKLYSRTYRVYGVDADTQTFRVDKLAPLHVEYSRTK